MVAKISEKETKSTKWLVCDQCGFLVYEPRYTRNLKVCPECAHHSRITAEERIEQLLDPGSVQHLPEVEVPDDPLGFVDVQPYAERLHRAREETGLKDAAICASGTVHGHPLLVCVMEFRFLGGSLGTAVGAKIVAGAEFALRKRLPFVLVTASGGARMQEGTLSLLQMAKTSDALSQLDEAGLLTVSVITDPTYGGVAASFATLTDVIIAEPGARLGFAGPRVIEQTIRQKLPEGFQSAEFLSEHGLIDMIRKRGTMRSTLACLLRAAHGGESKPNEDPLIRDPDQLPVEDPVQAIRAARHENRPTALDYAAQLLDRFEELHGDRIGGDCPAIVGGIGLLGEVPVMLIGHQKGRNLAERITRKFGMPNPEGYRKAARLMRLAGKLGLPVITLIDTPGAYPGIEAEERGQMIAIAENLRLMARLPVPVVAVVTGEGGSGGALALGVADRVLCLSSSVYSVISPEGCAAILWHDQSKVETAAQAMRIVPSELLRLGVIDGVVPEAGNGAHSAPLQTMHTVRKALVSALGEVDGIAERGTDALLAERRARLRTIGNPTSRKAAQ